MFIEKLSRKYRGFPYIPCPDSCLPDDQHPPPKWICYNWWTSTKISLSLKVHSLWQVHPSVQFSPSVVSDSLGPHGLQHTRPPCPSPTPRAYSNSCLLSRWCHPTISSSVVPFSSPVFPRIRVFSNESALHIRWPKDWSFSLSISPSSEYSGLISFRMDWLDHQVHPGCWTFCGLGTNAWQHVSISYHHTERLHCPTHTPWTSPPGPGNHWSFYCLCASAFSRMS